MANATHGISVQRTVAKVDVRQWKKMLQKHRNVQGVHVEKMAEVGERGGRP